MKIKIKSRNKKKVKRWLKKGGATERVGELIEKEISDNSFDHLDWLQQVLEEKQCNKDVISWVLNQSDPVHTLVTALSAHYISSNCQQSNPKDVASAIKSLPAAIRSISIMEVDAFTNAFVIYVCK